MKVNVKYIPSEHVVKLWWFKNGKRDGVAEWSSKYDDATASAIATIESFAPKEAK